MGVAWHYLWRASLQGEWLLKTQAHRADSKLGGSQFRQNDAGQAVHL
jgi:hypothetical protein